MAGDPISRLYELEAADYPDAWIEEMGLDRSKVALTKQSSSKDVQGQDHQIRLNGLPKIDPTGVFDPLIAHARTLPFLRAFVGGGYTAGLQLVNIWSISKSKGAAGGGYHSGLGPSGYSITVDATGKGRPTSQMLNVVWMLTDNGPHDGCMTVIPGSHKSSLPRSDHVRGPAGLRYLTHQMTDPIGSQTRTCVPGNRSIRYPRQR